MGRMDGAALGRQISSGLVGKLQFDFACQRGHGFSEAYIHGVILEVLTARLDNSTFAIRPGHALPALQSPGRDPDSPASGRKRELDFAAFGFAAPEELVLGIEAKWAGSSHASAANVVRDICRLAVVSQAHPDAVCLFVLAGRPQDVQRVLAHKVLGPRGKKQRSMLPYPYPQHVERLFHLVDTKGGQGLLTGAEATWLKSSFISPPHKLTSTLHKPLAGVGTKWDAQVWRIRGYR
jgi:hypothetical protein